MPESPPRLAPTLALAVAWLALYVLWLAVKPPSSVRPATTTTTTTTTSATTAG